MIEEATIHVLKKSKMKLRKWIQMAPYSVENLDESSNSGITYAMKHNYISNKNYVICDM